MKVTRIVNPRRSERLAHSKLAVFAVLLCALACQSAAAKEEDASAFSMQVMDAFSITGRGTVITGIVSTGTLETGDTVCIPLLDGGLQRFTISGIESFRKVKERVEAGQNVGLQVAEELSSKNVAKGEYISEDC